MTAGSARFAGVYALANFGAFLCFVPLIGLSLPQHMTQVAQAQGTQMLSLALLLGAVVASVSNIAAGAVSDRLFARNGSRMSLIGVGLVATQLSYVGLALAENATELIVAFLVFQMCFNILFAPMTALVTDYIPDGQKGRVFGLLSLALPLSQASIFFLALADVQKISTQLALVAIIAAGCILPLLYVAPPESVAIAPKSQAAIGLNRVMPQRDFALAWFARLFVQCASVAMGSYMFVHLSGLADDNRAIGSATDWMGRLSILAAGAGLFAGIILGAASDRINRRRPFLWTTALLVSAGCTVLALIEQPYFIAAGYAVFAFGLAGFLSVDSAMVAQLVGPAPDRAAALGIMNLTNTLSAVLVPAATIAMDYPTMVPTSLLFGCVATGALLAAALVALIKSVE